jgi:hypothetical protein
VKAGVRRHRVFSVVQPYVTKQRLFVFRFLDRYFISPLFVVLILMHDQILFSHRPRPSSSLPSRWYVFVAVVTVVVLLDLSCAQVSAPRPKDSRGNR